MIEKHADFTHVSSLLMLHLVLLDNKFNSLQFQLQDISEEDLKKKMADNWRECMSCWTPRIMYKLVPVYNESQPHFTFSLESVNGHQLYWRLGEWMDFCPLFMTPFITAPIGVLWGCSGLFEVALRPVGLHPEDISVIFITPTEFSSTVVRAVLTL